MISPIIISLGLLNNKERYVNYFFILQSVIWTIKVCVSVIAWLIYLNASKEKDVNGLFMPRFGFKLVYSASLDAGLELDKTGSTSDG